MAYAKVLNKYNINYKKKLFIDVTDISSTCVYMVYIQLSLYAIPAIVYCGNALTGETKFKMETPLYFLQYWKFRNSFIQKQKEIIVDKNKQNKFREVMVKGNSQIALF